MDVSIIMPVRNGYATLDKAEGSILSTVPWSEHHHIYTELVLVDDGSTDGRTIQKLKK